MTSAFRKLSILHVGNHSHPCVGGIESVIWNSATTMAQMGHDVGILVFDTCTEGTERLVAFEEKNLVKIHRVRQGGFSFYRTPPLAKVLEIVALYDVIHIHGLGGWADFLVALKLFHRKPIFVNTHGGFFHTANRALLKKVYQLLILPLVWRGFDYVFFDSDADAKRFSSFSYPDYSSIVPNGISGRFFHTFPLLKNMLNHFIFVGRLSKNKRVDRLIEAFGFAVKENPSLRLHIVGADWEGLRSQLEGLVSQLGLRKNVLFHGSVSSSEMMKLYSSCAFAVSASEYEGFGIGIIEAMGLGRMPVLNTIPTFNEFASRGRGFVGDFSHVEEGGKMIVKVAALPLARVQKISSACKKYAQHFSVLEVAKKHVDVYRLVLEKERV